MPAPLLAGAFGLVARITADSKGFLGAVNQAGLRYKKFAGEFRKQTEGLRFIVGGLAKGIGIIGGAFLAAFLSSEVFRDMLGGIFEMFGVWMDLISMMFLPVWEVFMEIMADMIPVIMDMTDALKPVFEIIAMLFKVIFTQFRPEIELLIKVFVLLLTLPIVAFLFILLGVISAILAVVRPFRIAFEFLYDLFLKLFSTDWGALGAGILSVLRMIWDGIRGFVNLILGAIEWLVNRAIDAVNMMDFAGIIPDIGHISLPRLEEGGIVAKTGLAVVHRGEAFSGVGGGGVGGPMGALTVNFEPGSIVLGAGATEEGARELVDRIREELRRFGYVSLNTLR